MTQWFIEGKRKMRYFPEMIGVSDKDGNLLLGLNNVRTKYERR